MKYFLILITFFNFTVAFAQVGSQFPKIETEKISGQTIAMPGVFAGNYALVGIGMGKKAEEALRTWQTPIYNKFIAKTGLMDDLYDVDVFFLPVFTGASRAAKANIVKKLRQNNEALVIDYVYIYSGVSDPFDSIRVDDKSEPYFLLVDRAGKIVYKAKGAFRQKYLDEITDILTDS